MEKEQDKHKYPSKMNVVRKAETEVNTGKQNIS